MTAIQELLQSIPPKWRRAMNAVFALTVVVVGILELANVDIPVDNYQQILLLIGGYLGVQSAANVNTTPEDAVDDFYALSEVDEVDEEPPPVVPGEHKA